MMIAWDDSLSSGIEEVDVQHKEFIKLIQRLQILHEKGSSRDFTLRILQELSKYAEYHFISEETLMIVTRYPMIEHHVFAADGGCRDTEGCSGRDGDWLSVW